MHLATMFVTRDGPIATLRLNRPERLNALTFEVYRELTDTFRALATRPHVRAVVVTGTGRAFCTGGDVKDIIRIAVILLAILFALYLIIDVFDVVKIG